MVVEIGVKIIRLSVLLMFYALSFIALENLPTWISASETYNILIYLLITVVFGFAFVKFGFD